MIGYIYISYYYVCNMPVVPQQETMRIIQFSIHGWKVYITEREFLLQRILFWSMFSSVMVSLLLGGMFKDKIKAL